MTIYQKAVVITNDTVFVDGAPYCILKQVGNTYAISTLDINEIIYIQPFIRNQKEYYKISITPLRVSYYAEKAPNFINHLAKNVVKYQSKRTKH